MLKIHVVHAGELTPAELRLWSGLARLDGGLDSPFFAPEYVRAVAAARRDVEVALLEDGHTLAGFFPFQRGWCSLGAPVGLKLSDLQGVVVHPEVGWTAEQLLRGCGLRSWHFDHLLADQAPFTAFHHNLAAAPCIDLRAGFAAWQEECRLKRSRLLSQVLRKERKLAREVGPIRFVARCPDAAVFATLLAWKAQRRRQTGTPNVLDYPWAVRVLDQVRAVETDDFAGMLSALYAGDELCAVHLGMRSRSVLHYWFPAFNPRFEHYSAGLILLVELTRTAAALGIARIDLGKGAERYKESLMTSALPLAEGAATLSPIQRWVDGAWYGARRLLRSSRVNAFARAPKRALRRVYFWSVMR